MEEIEIWLPIKDYEGLYEISNTGRVKSLERKDSNNHFLKERILNPGKDKDGYLRVNLYKNGIKEEKRLHRLVSEAFIPNPHNYPIINHIDSNPGNAHYKNLEWCTYSYNTQYSYDYNNRKAPHLGKIGSLNHNAVAVNQLDIHGNFIKRWGSFAEIQKELGINSSSILKVIKGIRNHAGGFKWEYA